MNLVEFCFIRSIDLCSNIPILGLHVSICNTPTTSKQTPMGLADGRKHRAKAKACHASHKQENGPEQTPNDKEIGGAHTTEPPELNDGKGADDSENDVDAAAYFVDREGTLFPSLFPICDSCSVMPNDYYFVVDVDSFKLQIFC